MAKVFLALATAGEAGALFGLAWSAAHNRPGVLLACASLAALFALAMGAAALLPAWVERRVLSALEANGGFMPRSSLFLALCQNASHPFLEHAIRGALARLEKKGAIDTARGLIRRRSAPA